MCIDSYQLEVKLSDHLHLQVDDVSVTGVSEDKEEENSIERMTDTLVVCFQSVC